MSTDTFQKNIMLHGSYRVTVVAAEYNGKFIEPLLENCLSELRRLVPQAVVDVVRVPGSFEVPVMVKRSIVLPEKNQPDVVIALGVILRGSTMHADLIATAITNQLMSISCETLVPVINEVMLLNDERQAFARCVASTLNRGRESAQAAAAMLANVGCRRQHERLSGVNRNASLMG